MKIVCGITGLLFILLANFLPLPDPGLPGALLTCGASLCLSALALELHPFIAVIAAESEIEQLHPRAQPPAPEASPEEGTPA